MNRNKKQNRRDRRKAKQSEWKRIGTVNPKKVAHHPYDVDVSITTKKTTRRKEIKIPYLGQ